MVDYVKKDQSNARPRFFVCHKDPNNVLAGLRSSHPFLLGFGCKTYLYHLTLLR